MTEASGSGARSSNKECSSIKFARVVFPDKTVDIVEITNIKNLLRNASALSVSDFILKNKSDFVQLKYQYAHKIACNDTDYCSKKK